MISVKRIKEERKKIQKEVKEKTIGYIVAAFGLVVGLAWNEAIKALIEGFFPLAKNTILAKFIYAILFTVILVIVSIYLLRLMKKEEK